MDRKATLDINLRKVIGSREPTIFGHFIEHFHRQIYGGFYDPESPLADKHGFRMDVIEALRRIQSPVIRWPGGCFASAYHWKKGVGDKRVAYFDKAWRVEEPNIFGTDEFIQFCRLVGSEPYICTNAGTGTSEEMSDWVEYCNQDLGEWAAFRRANGHDAPYHVRYWSIGNENYGLWEMGEKQSAEWGNLVRESAKMMKRVDPSIEVFAPGLPSLYWSNVHGGKWNETLLEKAGAYIDWLSIHYYWAHAEDPYEVCIARSGEPEKSISWIESLLDEYGYQGRIRIAFDEWNLRSWLPPGDMYEWMPPDFSRFKDITPDELAKRERNSFITLTDALFAARFFNTCLRHCKTLGMANFSPIVNGVGAIFTHAEGLVLRPTYHVFDLYMNHTGPTVLQTNVESPAFNITLGDEDHPVPHLDAVATLSSPKDRDELNLVLVNLHQEEALPCRIRLSNGRGRARVQVRMLTGESVDAFNDVEHPTDVTLRSDEIIGVDWSDFVYECPAHTVVVLSTEVEQIQ
jgi:alpha-N-arabinofuranosidase